MPPHDDAPRARILAATRLDAPPSTAAARDLSTAMGRVTRYGLPLAVLPAAGALAVFIVWVQANDPSRDAMFARLETALLATTAVAVAGLIVTWLTARAGVRREWAREVAWLRSLPFAVEHYLEQFGTTWIKLRDTRSVVTGSMVDEVADVSLTVVFAGESPGDAALEPRMRAVTDERLRFVGHARLALSADGGDQLRACVHRLVEHVLVPLHATHAIDALVIEKRAPR